MQAIMGIVGKNIAATGTEIMVGGATGINSQISNSVENSPMHAFCTKSLGKFVEAFLLLCKQVF
jgi:hypothetical protein